MNLEEVGRNIKVVWDMIGGDVLDVTDSPTASTELVVEMCVDAGRLGDYGSPEADEYASNYIEEHGWDGFVKAISPIIDPTGYNHWR